MGGSPQGEFIITQICCILSIFASSSSDSVINARPRSRRRATHRVYLSEESHSGYHTCGLTPPPAVIDRCFVKNRLHWRPPLIFAARCYASAAYAVMRCLSVCLFVTFVNSVETNKHIFQISSPSGSHTTLVFFTSNVMAILRRRPPNGGVECRWGRQKWQF